MYNPLVYNTHRRRKKNRITPWGYTPGITVTDWINTFLHVEAEKTIILETIGFQYIDQRSGFYWIPVVKKRKRFSKNLSTPRIGV